MVWVIPSGWTSSGGILRFYLSCYLRIGASGLIGHRGPKLWESKEAAETPDTFPTRHTMAMGVKEENVLRCDFSKVALVTLEVLLICRRGDTPTHEEWWRGWRELWWARCCCCLKVLIGQKVAARWHSDCAHLLTPLQSGTKLNLCSSTDAVRKGKMTTIQCHLKPCSPRLCLRLCSVVTPPLKKSL